MSPVFLALDEVLEIHRDQIGRYGGSLGVREMGLLESALAMPQAGFGGVYLHDGIFEMAAAYLFHLVNNHPFIDGNKRVGAMAAYAFLRLNGFEVSPSAEPEFEATVLAVASGKMTKSAVAEFFHRHATRPHPRRPRK